MGSQGWRTCRSHPQLRCGEHVDMAVPFGILEQRQREPLVTRASGCGSTPRQRKLMTIPLTVKDAKRAARALRLSLSHSGRVNLTHAESLETLAHTAGYRDWNTYNAALNQPRPVQAVPVLRVFDSAVARRFYCDYLGCELIFQHRFAADLPLYMRVARGEIELDLSEHHGDGTPGSVVWIAAVGLKAWHRELRSRDHISSLRPGIELSAPGGPTMELFDPFQNTLRICEPT